MFFLIIYILLVSSIYLFLVFYYLVKWSTYENSDQEISNKRDAISLLIPAYNEGESLVKLVNSLQNQTFSKENFEIIIIDDYSSIPCEKLLEDVCFGELDIRVLQNTHPKGKKYALLTGAENAVNQWIVSTDADCIPHDSWLETFAESFAKHKPKFIAGPVKMIYGDSFFQKFQALEFASLVGVGAASFTANSPIMCNGANLAFDKYLFIEAFSELKAEINTGDDMFLMEYAKKHFPTEMIFLKNKKAVVNTKVESGLFNFAKQRIRWSSKSFFYSDKTLISISLLIFLLNLNIILCLALGFKSIEMLYIALIQYGIKSVVDFFFLGKFLKFLDQKSLMKMFIPVQLVYPFYIVIAACFGLIKSINYRNA